MQDDESARGLYVDILLDDRCQGWAASVGSNGEAVKRVRSLFPDDPEESILSKARCSHSDAWAYRDELEAKTSSELAALAGSVVNRQKQAREAAEHKARIEQEAAMFASWARKAYWTQKEAALLAFGCDPAGQGSDDDAFYDLTDTIERAIKAGQLKREIAPPAFLAWLQRGRISVPPGLATAVAELNPPEPAPRLQERPPTALPFEIDGYDCPPELEVMLGAIKEFWVNADPARPPKKDEEIIPWIKERVGSDNKAKAIDMLIRPEWARGGGNKKKTKG